MIWSTESPVKLRRVTWRRILIWLVIAAALVRAASAVLSSFGMADLHGQLAAGNALAQGENPYAGLFEQGDGFVFPPFSIALFVPLSLLPEAVVEWLLVAGLVGAAIGIARLAQRNEKLTTNGLLLVLAVVLGSEVWHDSVMFGQISLFLVLAVLYDGSLPERSRWKGVLLGITAAIKLTPLAIVPFLLVGRQYRMAFRGLAVFVLASALGFLVAPGPSRTYWADLLWWTTRIDDTSSPDNFSMRGALERSFEAPVATSLWIALGMVFATSLCWLIYRRTGLATPIGATELSVIGGLASLVLAPITWTHHMGWMVVAVPLLWTRGFRGLAVGTAIAAVMPLFILSSDGYLGPWSELGLVIRLLLGIAAATVLAWGAFTVSGRAPGSPPQRTSVGSGA